MSENFYQMGSHNVICDICGKKRKREECRKTWDGFLACTVEKCWYPKHPNDLPRKIIPDNYPVIDARPRPPINLLPTIPWQGDGTQTWEVSIWEDPYLTWENDLSVLDPDKPIIL